MLVVCIGALLPWTAAGRSGILGDGKYALVLGAAGLTLYALVRLRRLDARWWRASSVPLAFGCLTVSAVALKGYGALGAIVTAVAAVAWLAISRRAASIRDDNHLSTSAT
jgi:hypothetical protein